MNRYKKSANTRRNEWIRSRIKKPLIGELVMSTWVCLPVHPTDFLRGDLDAEPLFEVELRKQEADATNYFLIHNSQETRYEKKSEWVSHKWKKKLKKDG